MNTLTKEQSKTLTLLKGFAIILVVMIHCDVRKALGAEPLSPSRHIYIYAGADKSDSD